MTRFRRLFLIAVAAVSGLALTPAQSDAGFAIRYSTDGGATFTTINNGDSPGDNSPSANIISISTSIGDFDIVDATGVRTSTPGTRKLDLNAISVQSAGGPGGTL